MKNVALFAAGFVAGFAALFALIVIFGDYEDDPVAAQPAEQVIAAASTPPPTLEPTATELPAATSTPSPIPPSPTPQATPTPLPTWTPVPPGFNTDVVVEGIRWRAISVQDVGNTLPGNDFTETATTTGKFVRVTMEVENRRGAPETYEAPDFADAQGRRFRAYSERFFYLSDEEDCAIRTFNPNLPESCVEIYEVPGDSGGYKLIVNNFEFIEPTESLIELR